MSRLVAVRLTRGADFVAALDAVWNDGDAILPLDPAAPEAAIRRALLQLRPAVLVDAHGRTDLPSPLPVAKGTAAVVTTSGTSGSPKGVVLSHRAVQAAAQATVARLKATAEDDWLCPLPLHHVAGLMVLVRARLTGGRAVVQERFDPARVAEERGAAFVSLVPTMLLRLLDANVDLTGFRATLLGGARCPSPLLERARGAGVRVVRTYGMTETCGGVVYDGVPLPSVDLRVTAAGEIELWGPMLFDGYRGLPDATRESLRDGWFRTRDVGRFDERGRLVVLGRVDDVIVTGGEKVVPGEVEGVLLEHPQVADAQVTGRKDREWGEVVLARIVPRGEAPTLEALRAFVKSRLPDFAAPRVVEVVNALERPIMDKEVRRRD